MKLALFAAIPTLLSVVEPAQSRAPGSQPPIDHSFAESLDVSLVELDVLVRGADGAPIRGLRARDFRVLENGIERPIGGFSERSAAGLEAADQGESTLAGSDFLDADLTTLVVFLDHAALRPDRRSRVLSSLERYLRKRDRGLLARSTRLALVSNDLPLDVQIPLTHDVEEFLDRLSRLPDPPASSARASLDRAQASERIGGGQGPSGSPTDLLDEVCNNARLRVLSVFYEYVAGVERRNARTLGGLDALFTILGGIPGRKTVLYVGEGLELQPGVEMAQRVANTCPDLQGEMLSVTGSIAGDLRALAANANAYRVTVYSFDAAGARADELLEPQLRQLRAANLQDSLNLLSRMTGGRLFRNIGDLRPALEQLQEDFAHSYSLAYVPADATEGALREVRVELVAPGSARARIVHRRAIRTVGVTDRLVAGLLSALWMGEQDNPLGIQVAATGPRLSGTLGVAIRAPYSALVLEDVQGESGESRKVRLFLMGRAAERGSVTRPREMIEAVRERELVRARATGFFEFHVDMDLEPGRWDVAVGVRDELTSRVSIVLVPSVDIGGNATKERSP